MMLKSQGEAALPWIRYGEQCITPGRISLYVHDLYAFLLSSMWIHIMKRNFKYRLCLLWSYDLFVCKFIWPRNGKYSRLRIPFWNSVFVQHWANNCHLTPHLLNFAPTRPAYNRTSLPQGPTILTKSSLTSIQFKAWISNYTPQKLCVMYLPIHALTLLL